MGQAGAEQVAFQHDVAIEARKLAALFDAVLETSAPPSPEAMISAQ